MYILYMFICRYEEDIEIERMKALRLEEEEKIRKKRLLTYL